MMRFTVWLGSLGLLIAAVGCSHPAEAAASGTNPTPPVAVSSAGASSSAPTTGPAPAVAPDPSKLAPQTKPDELKDWKPTTMTALELAAKVDASLSHISGETCDAKVDFVTPLGNGYITLFNKFLRPDEFSVEYMDMSGTPVVPHRHRVIASGGKEVDFNASGGRGHNNFGPVHPYAPSGMADGPDLLSKWIGEFPRLAMGHFIEGKDVFVPLVKTLSLPGSGYTTTCMMRTRNDAQGHEITEYQIAASRTGDTAAKFGTSGLEIIINGAHFVPVTMASKGVVPGGKKAVITQLHWEGHWKPGKMGPSDFKLP